MKNVSPASRVTADHSRAAARLESLFRLSLTSYSNESALVADILQEIVRLTGSTLSYLRLIGDDKAPAHVVLRDPQDSRSDSSWVSCIALPTESGWSNIFEPKMFGVRNELALDVEIKEQTEHSVHISRNMCVEVLADDDVVVVAGVANKSTPYDDFDLYELQQYMDDAWRILARLRGELHSKTSSTIPANNVEELLAAYDRSEALRRASEARWSALTEYAPVFVTAMDRDGTIRYLNRVKVDGLGNPSEVLGQRAHDLLAPEKAKRLDEILTAVFELRVRVPFESALPNSDGTTSYYEGYAYPVKEGGHVTAALFFLVDVTDRKTRDEELRVANELLQKLSAQAPGVLYQFVRRPDGTYELGYCSDSIYELFGVEADEVLGGIGPLFSHLNREELGDIIESIEDSAATLKPWRRDVRVDSSRYGVRWVLAESTPTRLEDGTVIWHGFAMDVTDRKENELALETSNRLQNIFLTHGDDTVFGALLDCTLDILGSPLGFLGYIDHDGSLVFPAYSRDVMPRAEGATTVLRFSRETWGGIWGDALKLKRTSLKNEDLKTPPGHIHLHRALVTPILYQDVLIGLLCVANRPSPYTDTDLPMAERIAAQIAPLLDARVQAKWEDEKRRHAEEALRESEEKYRTLFESANDAICIFDGLKLVDCNPRAIELYKMDSSKPPHESPPLMSPDFQPDGRHSATVATGLVASVQESPQSFEWRHILPDGTLLDVDVRLRPIVLNGKSYIQSIVRDVTEEKKAREALVREAARYKALLETSADGVHVLDLDGRVLEANDVFCRMLGYSREQMLSLSVYDWDPNVTPVRFKVVASQAGSQGLTFETINLCRDGSVFDVEVSVRLVELGGRKMVYCASRDITERKRAENAVLRSERRYRQLMEQAGDAIAVLNRDGVITEANAAAVAMFGYTMEEMIGMQVAETYLPEERMLAFQRIHEVDYDNPYSYERVLVRKDGGKLNVRITFVRVDDDTLQAIYHDVTLAKQAEKSLRELVVAMEHAPDAVLVADAQGTVTYVNPAFEDLAGYSRAQVVGATIGLIEEDAEEPWFSEAAQDIIATRSPWRGHVTHTRSDGTMYKESKTVAPIWDPSGGLLGYVSIGRDVTRELELEDLLRQAQKMEAVGQLAGGVAHDFNNILQAISGYIDLAGAFMESDIGESREHLDQARQASDRAAILTRQLLAFSRRQMLDLRILDLNQVLNDLLKMVRRVIGEDVALKFVPGDDLPAIHGDAGQLHQVILNLCVNARDAMPNGGVIHIETASMELSPELAEQDLGTEPGTYVTLTVNDSGHGMNEDVQSRIFEPFFTTKEIGKGTGLGLAMVYGIVKQHKGFINVDSEPGRGTSFILYLPAHLGPKEAGRPISSVGPSMALNGTETILLAEDEVAIRMLSEMVLTQHGYSVLSAADGEAAVELFRAHEKEIDLAVLDVVMPKMNGKDVYSRIRALRPDIPVLFCSGYPATQTDSRLIDTTHHEILHKPYPLNDLLQRVRHVLDSV